MPLQSQVSTSVAVGVPGAKADSNIFDYYPQSLTAETDVEAGTFVWLGSDPEKQAAYFTDTDADTIPGPIGFVERVIAYPNYDVLGDGTMTVNEGEVLTIATQGAFFVVIQNQASVGMPVYADPATGLAFSGNPGSKVATGWKTITAGAAGETIIIKRI